MGRQGPGCRDPRRRPVGCTAGFVSLGGGALVVDDEVGVGVPAGGGCGAFVTLLIDTMSTSPFRSIVTVSVVAFLTRYGPVVLGRSLRCPSSFSREVAEKSGGLSRNTSCPTLKESGVCTAR